MARKLNWRIYLARTCSLKKNKKNIVNSSDNTGICFLYIIRNRKIIGTTIKKRENNITNRNKPRARTKLLVIYKTN